MDLNTNISQIPRIGPQYEKKLNRLGIEKVRDLLFHFPFRYEDFSSIVKIKDLKLNEVNCIEGKILKIKNQRTWKKRMYLTESLIEDDTGQIKAVWFNQPYLADTLKPETYVYLAGKLSQRDKKPYLSNPIYERSKEDTIHTGRIVPVYPETEGLSSRFLRFIIKPILNNLKSKITDYLPDEIKKEYELLPLETALSQIHFPESMIVTERARNRFAFEELFILSLLLLRERMKLNKEKAPEIKMDLEEVKKFVSNLPFELTDDQKKAAYQILKDLEKNHPMNRLLEGDVGSGKTVVAVIAALNTAKRKFQSAFMVPTEILARQHFSKISHLLKHTDLTLGFIISKEAKIFFKNKEEKIPLKEFFAKAEEGFIDILIGTHSLIQEGVRFKNLGLVIVDEQHRFGVEQRAKLLRQKSLIPHLLSMTATPIPRTLALTIYGDLDLSLIKEMPKGRKKIETKIIPPKQRKEAYDFIKNEVKKGRQVFVVCPRIEEGMERINLFLTEVKAVKKEYEKLHKEIFPDLCVSMIHGKMKTKEKENIMKDFEKGEIDILVSTSLIEVGIDIKNATVMMIEGADKFGLAQLHQFRGRVGRGEHQSYCLLFTDSPSRLTFKRLKALVSSDSGFELAEKDLDIRGPGSFVGERQWGIPDLVMASFTDLSLIEKTRQAAKNLLLRDKELKQYPLLQEKLSEFRQRIHLE